MLRFLQIRPARNILAGIGIALGLGITLVVHIFLLSLPDDATTPLFIVDRLFDLCLAGVFSLGAIGIGRWLLSRLGWNAEFALAQSVLAWGIGAGVLSHCLLLIGLMHILSRPVALSLLGIVVALTVREWSAMVRELWQDWQAHAPFSRLERILVCVLVLVALPVLLGALTPPTDVDALSYQLAAPALFLKQGAVVPMLENTGANYPLGGSMLFIFGLSAASPIAAQLTHFLFGVALMVSIYVFASQNFGRTVGLIASAILWTSAEIGLEANAPLVDLAWVFYEFLAIWLFWLWHQTHSWRALILMAVCLGFAMSNKYLALVGLGTLGLFVIGDGLMSFRRVWPVLKCGFVVAGVAVLVASPWYLKNQLMLGNPVYPFFLGAYGLDGLIHHPDAGLGLSDWVGAGMGNDLQALLLFPYNVYAHWQNFDPVKNRGGPSLFFWFLPLYLVASKRSLINVLVLVAAIRFGIWWSLTQTMRYGLILFPILCVICGYIVWDLFTRVKNRWGRPLLEIVVVLFFVVGVILQWGFILFLHEGSLSFLLGSESRADYLDMNLLDYRAIHYINTALPADAKIFALGNVRVFYAQRSIVGDVTDTNWPQLTELGRTPEGVRERLKDLGVTHIWVSEDEIVYAENYWKIPAPWQNAILSFYAFRDCCLEQVYGDERGNSIYALRRLSIP